MLARDSKHWVASAGAFGRACEQAACSLCYAYGMDAFRGQQQACVWKAAPGGTCVRYHSNRCDLIELAAPNGFRLQLVAMRKVHSVSPLA